MLDLRLRVAHEHGVDPRTFERGRCTVAAVHQHLQPGRPGTVELARDDVARRVMERLGLKRTTLISRMKKRKSRKRLEANTKSVPNGTSCPPTRIVLSDTIGRPL